MAASDSTAQVQFPGPSREFFQEISGTLNAPWEIGKAQPEIVRLTSAGVFDGKSVLDVGCCIGDNTLHVAQHAKGARVTGCDMVERALEVARSKAAAAGLDVPFVQQDLLVEPQGELQGKQFDVILDSAVYHCFARGSQDRDDYVTTLGRLLKPGGRVVMCVFSEKQPGDNGPVRVTTQDLHGSFPPPAWMVDSIEDGVYETIPSAHNGQAQAYVALITKNA